MRVGVGAGVAGVGSGGGCDLCGVNYFHLKLFDPVDYLKLERILTEKQQF